MIGIVSRFADQKGFDLISEKVHELMKEDVVLVALGTGERKYQILLQMLAATYPRVSLTARKQRSDETFSAMPSLSCLKPLAPGVR
ncbi:MAG TPA: hypothetical protein VJN92_19785 [Candidatus Acidoferrum sp.]|nr:hypothetical protein [Candidatus Acidoferrum sp.]